VTPARLHMDAVEREYTVPITSALTRWDKHCLILGQPGAGKTTSVKKLCSKFFNEGIDEFSFPLLIRFRDLEPAADQRYTLTLALMKLLPIEFNLKGFIESSPKGGDELRSSTFHCFLDFLKPLIILDGFDEYPDAI
jgi:predicted NACHT family NTPase